MKTIFSFLISFTYTINCFAITTHRPLTVDSVTQHKQLQFEKSGTFTNHPKLWQEKPELPKVKVYVNSDKQLKDIQNFAGCVPQIEFVAALNVPEWVKEYPTYQWIGDDEEEYYFSGDLEEFTKKFVKRNPSFSQRVRFDYVEAYETGYPVRSNHWSVLGNFNPTKEETIYHLTYHPNHWGRYNVDWMWTQSKEQLLTLHDDDHTKTKSAKARIKKYANKFPKPAKIVVKEISLNDQKEVIQQNNNLVKYKSKEIEKPKKYIKKEQTVVVPEPRVLNIFRGKKVKRVRSCPGGFCPTY